MPAGFTSKYYVTLIRFLLNVRIDLVSKAYVEIIDFYVQGGNIYLEQRIIYYFLYL